MSSPVRNRTTIALSLAWWSTLFILAHLPASSQRCAHPISECMPRWSCLRRDSTGCPYCAPECRLDRTGCPPAVACLRMLGCTEEVNGCVVCTKACTVRSEGRPPGNFEEFSTFAYDEARAKKQEGQQQRPSPFSILSSKVDTSLRRREDALRQSQIGSSRTTVISEPGILPTADDSINDV